MVVRVREFSTRSVDDPARSRRWEDWNRSALIGLRCETPDGRGLQGTERTLHLPDVTLGLVSTEAHRVRRDADSVASTPSDSLVVYAVLRGRSTFTDRRGARVLAAGDVLVADPDEPFERTLPTHFRELVLKVPRSVVPETLLGCSVGAREPRRPDGIVATRIRALGDYVAAATRRLDEANVASVTQVCVDLLADLTIDSGRGDRAALATLLVDQHLHSASLSAAWLADKLQLSVRQLSRLLAEGGTTFPRLVTERRVARARDLLLAEPGRSVADIARACGFSSAAYFSRAFSDAVGRSPSSFRSSASPRPHL